MNPQNEAVHAELAALTSRMLENSLTIDEDARLTEILNAHPELIEEYTNQIHLDSLLTSNLYAAVPEEISLETLEASETESNQSADVVVAANVEASGRSRWNLLSWVSAVVVMLLVGGLFWFNQAERQEIAEQPIAVTPSYAGMLLDTEDAVWGDTEADEIPYGTKFPAGESLLLKSGIARIRFESGAGVMLEGPAQIELSSPLNAVLHYGTLSAYVPEEAEGFTVDTDKIRIIDQGTRFGAVVDASGEAEVHVFEGEVDVKSVSAEHQMIANLKASQALRFSNGAVKGAEISVTPTKFADVPTPEQLIAAKSGSYPPHESPRFENLEPMNQISLIKEKSALPAGILVGEDFEYPTALLFQQSGGVGFSHEGWWSDQNFTRLMVPEKRMGWGGLDGGPMIVQARGHHHAHPSLAHRIARKLERPLTDDFYFSMLVQYHGVDEDDFFGLWFDRSMGGMGTSHAQVPSIGFKEGKFFARFNVKQEAFFEQPVDDETFLLVGHLSKKKSNYFNHLEFWVNPAEDRSKTPDAVVKRNKGANLLKSINALGVRIGQYTEVSDSLYLDRLIIGDTFESVTQPTDQN
ncbi:FecR domain-containing protein [uncultured Gimesia sp.]|uniref:FecR domain-containing protein n=1 Tax=uncultured Gimesia sp. TaxID=1678688 RepID=UPI0030DBCE07|tara:strand:+ start:62120 stop:63859 length:1740 start_codon:yes stop_codon:yes gene_type:complete